MVCHGRRILVAVGQHRSVGGDERDTEARVSAEVDYGFLERGVGGFEHEGHRGRDIRKVLRLLLYDRVRQRSIQAEHPCGGKEKGHADDPGEKPYAVRGHAADA